MTREEALEFIAQSVKSDVDMAKVADAIKAIEQEPRKGKWITRPHVYGVTYCSECDFAIEFHWLVFHARLLWLEEESND